MSAAFTRSLPIGTKMHKLLFGIKLLPSSGEYFYMKGSGLHPKCSVFGAFVC